MHLVSPTGQSHWVPNQSLIMPIVQPFFPTPIAVYRPGTVQARHTKRKVRTSCLSWTESMKLMKMYCGSVSRAWHLVTCVYGTGTVLACWSTSWFFPKICSFACSFFLSSPLFPCWLDCSDWSCQALRKHLKNIRVEKKPSVDMPELPNVSLNWKVQTEECSYYA